MIGFGIGLIEDYQSERSRICAWLWIYYLHSCHAFPYFNLRIWSGTTYEMWQFRGNESVEGLVNEFGKLFSHTNPALPTVQRLTPYNWDRLQCPCYHQSPIEWSTSCWMVCQYGRGTWHAHLFKYRPTFSYSEHDQKCTENSENWNKRNVCRLQVCS
jgi:hypothetical protein